MPEIKQELIEKALSLCGKSMEDKIYWNNGTPICVGNEFSYPKFFYYILSPEFIERYSQVTEGVKDENGHTMYEYRKIYSGTQLNRVEKEFKAVYYTEIGNAIYEYQSGNTKPLEDLLSKI